MHTEIIGTHAERFSESTSLTSIEQHSSYSLVAQLVARTAVNRMDSGSSPDEGAVFNMAEYFLGKKEDVSPNPTLSSKVTKR